MLGLQNVKKRIREPGLVFGLGNPSLARTLMSYYSSRSYIFQVELSLPSCVCIGIKSSLYAISKHPHVHIDLADSAVHTTYPKDYRRR